jgi:GT2 family glycosyltransferase
MNAGIEWWRERAPDRPVLLLTPDARMPDDVAAALFDELAADARTGAVGPVIVYRDEPHGRIGAGGSIDPSSARIRLLPRIASPTPYDADWIEGCCVMLRPEAMRAVAGFDEEYFLYYEEIDLCERLRRAGWRVRVVPSVRVRHPKGAGQPPHYYYYMTRNAYRFWAKHFGIGTAAAALQAVRSTAWLGAIALRSLVVPARWSEVRTRWRDWWLQLRGAWTGTRDHLRGRYGPQAEPTRRPG